MVFHNEHMGQNPSNSKFPLKGIRVIEFTEFVAAPLVGKLLAEHGAQVIVVENEAHLRTAASGRHPGHGATDLTSLNMGNMFNHYGTTKMSVTINLRDPTGIEIVKRLISLSDIVLDNFAPRVMQRWGLTYEDLTKVRPDIIVVSMPTMGKGGPYEHHRSTSWNQLALCGYNHLTGFPDRIPICASIFSHPDNTFNPFHAATAILAALCYRAKTGKGQRIEVAQFESTMGCTETGIFEYLVNSQAPTRMGNRVAYAAPHDAYRCKGDDRWCAIAVFTDKEWESLCRVIGKQELAQDSRFATLQGRIAHIDELDRLIEEWTIQRIAEEVMDLMQAAGIAAGKVQNVEDLLHRDPQLRERGYWITVDHPEAGGTTSEGWGFTLSAMPEKLRVRAPLLGEHNDFVFQEILGMSEEEVNHYIVEGVIA